MTWKPLHLIAVAIAGWMNREQQDVSEYPQTGMLAVQWDQETMEHEQPETVAG
jgi:hypothetical protein